MNMRNIKLYGQSAWRPTWEKPENAPAPAPFVPARQFKTEGNRKTRRSASRRNRSNLTDQRDNQVRAGKMGRIGYKLVSPKAFKAEVKRRNALKDHAGKKQKTGDRLVKSQPL